jgi:Carboxymuconolactone decarboxylase family
LECLSGATCEGYSRVCEAGAGFNEGLPDAFGGECQKFIAEGEAAAVDFDRGAVTTRRDGCITFPADAALKAGGGKEEIAEALGVAIAMNAGAAFVYSLRALDSVDAHSKG